MLKNLTELLIFQARSAADRDNNLWVILYKSVCYN